MSDIPYIRLTRSQGQEMIQDCGVCAISTLLDKRYEDVAAVARDVAGERWKKGLWATQLIEIAKRLGATLKKRGKFDLETDTGVLDARITDEGDKKPCRHFVVLWGGKVYDWDGRVWATDAYTEHYTCTFTRLLELI